MNSFKFLCEVPTKNPFWENIILHLFFFAFSVSGALIIYGGLELNNTVCAALFRPLKSNTKKELEKLPTSSQLNADVHQETTTESIDLTPAVQETRQNGETRCNNEVETEEQQSILSKYCSMLSNVYFLLYGLQIICMSICIQTFFTYVPSLAQEHGSSEVASALLVSIQGATEVCGRILSGFVFDMPSIRHRRRHLHSALLMCGGTTSIIAGLMTNYWVLAILAAFFGFVMGSFHAHRATVVSEFVPPHQMATSVGFVMSFQSIGSITGTPISGLLKDYYETYTISFFFSGTCALAAGCLFMFSQVCLKRILTCAKNSTNGEIYSA